MDRFIRLKNENTRKSRLPLKHQLRVYFESQGHFLPLATRVNLAIGEMIDYCRSNSNTQDVVEVGNHIAGRLHRGSLFKRIWNQHFQPRFLERKGRMDAEWDEVARLMLPPPGKNALPTPIKCMAFDTHQELLWAGNDYGRVSSFYSVELQPYTSFRANSQQKLGPIWQLLFNDKGVIALSSQSIHLASRRGTVIWHLEHEGFKDLRCMSFTSKGMSEILIGGYQDVMFVIDLHKGEVTKEIPTKDHYKIMKRSRYICAATQTGTINILDPISFTVLKSWIAHSSAISDMDAQHDFIVTCGFTMTPMHGQSLDRLVNVFDLKQMTALPPIPFPAGAAYLRMHPRMVTTCFVVSSFGQTHIVDLVNPNTTNVRQASVVNFVSIMEIAPSGEAIAIADGGCNMLLWGAPSRIKFTDLPIPTEFPDAPPPVLQSDWNDNTPLNNFGMPYYHEELASNWPNHMIHEVGAPPPKIDPQMTAGMTAVDGYLYGANKNKGHRNEVENTRDAKTTGGIQAPKFLSEKGRESANGERRIHNLLDEMAVKIWSRDPAAPSYLQVQEIQYGRFGIDDFDFASYNRTSFSGLETHISNSYANPLLQILRFTPLIRNVALKHAATACVNELCLLCEMGFLFDMMEKADGTICQATNLLKTFSNHPQAAQLGLLEEEPRGVTLTTMLQGLNRFLMEKIVLDYRNMAPIADVYAQQLLVTSATTSIRCMACRNEHTRPGTTFTNDLHYSAPPPNPRNARSPKVTFSQILKSSIERDSTNRGWCNRCNRYQSLATRNAIHSIPAVLLLNAAIISNEARTLWGTPGWLPDEIGVILDKGLFFCFEGDDLKLHLQRGNHNIVVYSLIGLAAEINGGQNMKPNLVSLINVANSMPTPQKESQWHLFNDFLVGPLRSENSSIFNTAWKLPSVIAYQVKTAVNKIDDSWKQNLDTTLLYNDLNSNVTTKTYTPLSPEVERPARGSIIAIDAEFVSIRQQEIEVNSDGKRAMIRPVVHAVARISVIRGASAEFNIDLEPGEPFIDDYIAATEPVVDYLTNFSGISAGDLDPHTSMHHLVSRKIAYKKLWILLNLGCMFLGHGLTRDFRVINIHVPKDQVIDTSHYFFLKEYKRKLGLSFLSWFLLNEKIQQETHDSIEDARTALKLYQKYLEFKDAGILQQKLAEIYTAGREMNYKPPGKSGIIVPEGFGTPRKH